MLIFRFLTPKPLPGAPHMPGMRGQRVPLQPPVPPDSDVARGAKGLCPGSQAHSVPSLSTSVSPSEKWAATRTVVCSSQAHGRGAPRWIKAAARICMLGLPPSQFLSSAACSGHVLHARPGWHPQLLHGAKLFSLHSLFPQSPCPPPPGCPKCTPAHFPGGKIEASGPPPHERLTGDQGMSQNQKSRKSAFHR